MLASACATTCKVKRLMSRAAFDGTPPNSYNAGVNIPPSGSGKSTEFGMPKDVAHNDRTMTLRQKRTLWGVTIGHAAHDTWYGVAPILLASLSGQMRLSNADIGLMLLLYQALSSVSQPFFGQLSERVGGRPLAVGAILWTTLMFSGTLFAQSKLVLALCIFLAGLGSGAWHPQGAANATISGGERLGATTASIFFQGGTLGMALLGSALGGYLLNAFGRDSLLLLSFITVLVALSVVRRMVPRRIAVARGTPRPGRPNKATIDRRLRLPLAFLLLATALRSLAYHSVNTYIPKYQQDLGVSPAVYGLVLSLFLIATAVGGVAGSYLADRVGLRRVLAGSMALGGLFFFPFVRTCGVWSYASLVLSGFLLGPSHVLLIVTAQRRFPQRMATASGIFLGFNFGSGAVGAWLLGVLADQVGLSSVLGALTWALVGASLCALVAVPRALPGPDWRRGDSVA